MTSLDNEISEARSEIIIHSEANGPSCQFQFLQSTLDELEKTGAILPCDHCEAYHLNKNHSFTVTEVETLMYGDM